MDFLHQFTPTHLVVLVASGAAGYLGRAIGKYFARNVSELNSNLRQLNATILKTDILWERQADAPMWAELEKREKAHAKGA